MGKKHASQYANFGWLPNFLIPLSLSVILQEDNHSIYIYFTTYLVSIEIQNFT